MRMSNFFNAQPSISKLSSVFGKDNLSYSTPTKFRVKKIAKSLRHLVFPGGPPSKYYLGPTMLNFRDQTRTGVFIVVWSKVTGCKFHRF